MDTTDGNGYKDEEDRRRTPHRIPLDRVYEERRLITRHTNHTGHNARAIHPNAYLPSIITLLIMNASRFLVGTPTNRLTGQCVFELTRKPPLAKKKKNNRSTKQLNRSSPYWQLLRRVNSTFFIAHTTHYYFPLSILLITFYLSFISLILRRVVVSFTSLYYISPLVPR